MAGNLSAKDTTTAYLRLAIEIKDILTVCYPQFYNSGSMNGYDGSVVSPGNADFLTSLCTLYIEKGSEFPGEGYFLRKFQSSEEIQEFPWSYDLVHQLGCHQ